MTHYRQQPLAVLSTPVRWLQPGPALLLMLALSACGDGALESERLSAKLETASKPHTVQFTGCVVDQYFVPNEGVQVRALGADGRLLGNARSGQSGEFRLRLPADTRVAVQVDTEDGESMAVKTQDRDEQVSRCLVARAL